MKLKKNYVYVIILIALIIGITSIVQNIETTSKTHNKKTIIKGKVHNWVSDTIYINKLSFHSPYSSWIEKQIISKDGTFQFEWDDIEEPMVFSLSLLKPFSDTTAKCLFFENMTAKHYMSYCLKYSQNATISHYVEPNTTVNIDLISNTWVDSLSNERVEFFRKLGAKVDKDNKVQDYGVSEIKYLNPSNAYSSNYFNKFHHQLIKIENVFDSYSLKNIDLAIANLEKVKKQLLDNLKRKQYFFAKF